MVVVVNMRLAAVFPLKVTMRPVAVLHRGVVVLMAVRRGQMLPPANTLTGVRAVVRDMGVFVLMLHCIMDVSSDFVPWPLPGQTSQRQQEQTDSSCYKGNLELAFVERRVGSGVSHHDLLRGSQPLCFDLQVRSAASLALLEIDWRGDDSCQ